MENTVIKNNEMTRDFSGAKELKSRCLEVVDSYMGQPITDKIKHSICSEIHNELLRAFDQKLIREKPTDIRIGPNICPGTMILFHGPFYLFDWIENMWGLPAITSCVCSFNFSNKL